MSEEPRPGSGAMFDGIARRYDLLNRLMSGGIDRRWRARAVQSLMLREGQRVLDLATGTGDLAIALARSRSGVTVVGLDPSAKMLEVGRAKVEAAGLSSRITFREGVAERLPFPDRSFDAVTIAFGIRNVPDRLAGLREMARVTKAGGRIAILELSEPRSGLLSGLARFHVHEVVPRLGAAISGAKEYRYLQQSIAAFPAPEVFAGMMRDAGIEVLEVAPLTFGTCCLYVGTVA